MYGMFQTSFYFGYINLRNMLTTKANILGYMIMFSVALGLFCGTVGYVSSASFVHKIYSRIKLD